MSQYELDSVVSSPVGPTTFLDFSSNGRFLVVGGQDPTSLHVLDRLAGFHPMVSFVTPAEPTALVWETPKTFYAGFRDGRFVHYRIDLGENRLVAGATNNFFHGSFPITAMALDAESETLVLSVGPEIFMFRRILATSRFHFIANISNRFKFKKDPGTPAPPFPRSISFTSSNSLIITFCRQNIASITLEFNGGSHLCTSLQMSGVDYSGLPLLKAVVSASGDEINRLTRSWIHGSPSETGFPFLFINEGGETLSGSEHGAAIIRDAVTHREIEQLQHCALSDSHVRVMAYHVSNDKSTIATVSTQGNSNIKIWTRRKSPSHPQGWTARGFVRTAGKLIVALVLVLVVVVLHETGGFPSIKEITRFQLALAKTSIEIGYFVLDAAEDVVARARNALD